MKNELWKENIVYHSTIMQESLGIAYSDMGKVYRGKWIVSKVIPVAVRMFSEKTAELFSGLNYYQPPKNVSRHSPPCIPPGWELEDSGNLALMIFHLARAAHGKKSVHYGADHTDISPYFQSVLKCYIAEVVSEYADGKQENFFEPKTFAKKDFDLGNGISVSGGELLAEMCAMERSRRKLPYSAEKGIIR